MCVVLCVCVCVCVRVCVDGNFLLTCKNSMALSLPFASHSNNWLNSSNNTTDNEAEEEEEASASIGSNFNTKRGLSLENSNCFTNCELSALSSSSVNTGNPRSQ